MKEKLAGWFMSTLSNAGNWGSGGTPLRTNNEYYENGTIPWLVIGDLNDGYVIEAKNKITEKGLLNSSAKLVPSGTLLIAMYGSIGKLGLTKIACATNQAIAFCEIDEELFYKKYLFYFLLNSRKSLISLGKGGAQQNISQGIAHSFPHPYFNQFSQALARNEIMNKRDFSPEDIASLEALSDELLQSIIDGKVKN
jgi:type I restriction enzyme, S subunit